MSNRNKLVIWGWIAIIVAVGVYPPWSQRGYPAGYHLIFAPPNRSLHVDQLRLVIEWVISTVVAADLYFVWPTRGSGK